MEPKSITTNLKDLSIFIFTIIFKYKYLTTIEAADSLNIKRIIVICHCHLLLVLFIVTESNTYDNVGH